MYSIYFFIMYKKIKCINYKLFIIDCQLIGAHILKLEA